MISHSLVSASGAGQVGGRVPCQGGGHGENQQAPKRNDGCGEDRCTSDHYSDASASSFCM